MEEIKSLPHRDSKQIMDIINKAYGQLKENYLNIIFVIVNETWWVGKDDAEDALRENFKGPSKIPLLNAVVFCQIASPPNYFYQNPNTTEIDQELQSSIEKMNVEV